MLIDKEKFVNDIKKDLNISNFAPTDFDNDFNELSNNLDTYFNNSTETDNTSNIYTNCIITQEEANTGCKKDIRFNSVEICEITHKTKNVTKTMTISIPPNIQNGQKILLKEQGNLSQENSKRGNLLITILVTEGRN